jgi:hypothetical protein
METAVSGNCSKADRESLGLTGMKGIKGMKGMKKSEQRAS